MLTVQSRRWCAGFSFFGVSFVYIIFEDGTDIYWARSRVLDISARPAPQTAEWRDTHTGPDATGVGWSINMPFSQDKNLATSGSLQDWTIRYA